MIKVLYLLAGIMLKQTVDELKSVVQEYVAFLKANRDSIQVYRPNPAIQAGTLEAYGAMRAHEHRGQIQPEVMRLTRRILLVRLLMIAFYVGVTISLLVWIWVLEKST